MRRWRRQQMEVEVLDELRCDRCGHAVRGYDAIERQLADTMTFATLATFTASWGYESRRDGQRWHAELCEDCAERIRQIIDSGAGTGIQAEPADRE